MCTRLGKRAIIQRCLSVIAQRHSLPKELTAQSLWNLSEEACATPCSDKGPLRYLWSASSSLISHAADRRLELIQEQHAELSRQLSGPQAATFDAQKLTSLHQQLGELQPAADALQALQAVKGELADLQEVLSGAENDDELQRMAASEQKLLREQVPALEQAVLHQLLPKDATNSRNIILEVRAGTGGDEAALFAAELMHMYQLFCTAQGWRFEVLEMSQAALGGVKQASAAVSGTGVYGTLRWESGVHRVQRVPATETSGRLHTSAASVAVMPQADAVEAGLRSEDLRIDTYRSGGAGGQHVNTTNSAVRITHVPTGVVVAIQDERSQHRNKAKALQVLQARLYERARLANAQAQSAQRKGLIGSGDRSERIRTYNFPQGRVTDHRISLTEHGIESVLSGEKLPLFIEALQQQHQAELLHNL